jgi:CheY-like chemotaxis protein
MSRPHRHHPHVLVVDDDAELRISIRALLESLGYVVSTVCNSCEAIAEIDAQRPDAILTDIYMPEGDGYELITMVREFGDDIPIVAMSGGPYHIGNNDYLAMAERLGAVASIAKPFRPAELVETIDRAIGRRAMA